MSHLCCAQQLRPFAFSPARSSQVSTRPCVASRAAETAVAELPSTARPSTTQPAPVADNSGAQNVLEQKLSLLQEIAGTNRGAFASLPRHRNIRKIVDAMQGSCKLCDDPFSGSPAPIDGTWELLYTTAEAFRSSPFFWAFQEGLVQDQALASAIFQFTDAIPGATIGRASQTISMAASTLVSEVDLTVFPGLSGTVVTSATIGGQADGMLGLKVLNTRVADSNLFPFLDSIVVPVSDIFERMRGPDAAAVSLQVLYLDADLRVTQTAHDRELFVYRRVSS